MIVARISVTFRFGTVAQVDIQAENCTQIVEALKDFEQLNVMLEAMIGDLGRRVFPDGEVPPVAPEDAP